MEPLFSSDLMAGSGSATRPKKPFNKAIFMSAHICHHRLFSGSYLKQLISDSTFPRKRELPPDGRLRLSRLLEIWENVRSRLVEELPDSQASDGVFAGLPPNLRPVRNVSESVTENELIGRILSEVLDYTYEQNRTRAIQGLSEQEGKRFDRPDMILFRDKALLTRAVKHADATGLSDAFEFCRDADFVLDAKKFEKGVGTDESEKKDRKSRDSGAVRDIAQVSRYIRRCGKTWGILSNGRSWRLMRQGKERAHLRFDLILFLEDLRKRERGEKNFGGEDLENFALFYHFFGHPAVGGGYLDQIYNESEADNRRISDILRENAYEAVSMIAEGFWRHAANKYPNHPSQDQLDHLRELSLTFLYRLLFVLKAEAQGLLPMRTETGANTDYAERISTYAIFKSVESDSPGQRERFSEGFEKLDKLFRLISTGGEYDVPAYNGGLFDSEIHPELSRFRLYDNVVHYVLQKLIYLKGSEPVPYAELDVRDFGDIYEGLLEQRLVLEKKGGDVCLTLRNKKGERKGSGSYFTPDVLVDHVVRETLNPLLEACRGDAEKVLAMKVLDPAMGSGHFLVKVIDIMAWHLTLHCNSPGMKTDRDAPDDGGPEEYAYWKRRVAENCVYGVDYNPMAVELAKVAIWLHIANKGEPLSFLDHHLKCGNSLAGADLGNLARPGLESKSTRSVTKWKPPGESKQMLLPFEIDEGLFSDILEDIADILKRPDHTPEDIRAKRRDYMAAVGKRLGTHGILCDLWCAQWFLAEPDNEGLSVYESLNGLYNRVKKICGIREDRERQARAENLNHAFLEKIGHAREQGYGPRPVRFFHWQIEFPDAAFSEEGKLKETFGFDAVVGNPPWDKIKAAKRDFYGPFDENVANRQGTSLNRLIAEMEKEKPELGRDWANYEKTIKDFNAFLTQCGAYKYQATVVEGRKTGGDPDLFRYFIERASHCVRKGGRVGLVVPCTLWQGQGCTALRQMLFEKNTLLSIHTFENYRKWAFDIHSSFKFTTFVFAAELPPKNHSFPAVFMLRDTKIFEGKSEERIVRLSENHVRTVSPTYLALLDNKSDAEACFIEKVHRKHPMLVKKASGWNVRYHTDLHMTADSWLFKTREWMQERGFTRVFPYQREDGTWTQEIHGPHTAVLPDNLPPGGEYWLAADEQWYRERHYIERIADIGEEKKRYFVHPEDLDLENKAKFDPQKDYRRIFPGERYTTLYEGRMIHNFDHSQKRYLRGEGRKAIWEDMPISEKILQSRAFLCKAESQKTVHPRIGFCDITGATNERSILAAMIGGENLAGNKVPCLIAHSTEDSLVLLTILCSFCSDALIRLRISTNLTWNFLSNLCVPPLKKIPAETKQKICELVARLNCTTPELAEIWEEVFPHDPWTYESPERDLWKRAEIRAELDAITAELYGFTVEEYARILTGFPLLDRDQPALPGDLFLTEGDEKSRSKCPEGEKWIEGEDGIFELRPRGFITRDLALLTYMRHKKYAPPQKLDEWYKKKAGFGTRGALLHSEF